MARGGEHTRFRAFQAPLLSDPEQIPGFGRVAKEGSHLRQASAGARVGGTSQCRSDLSEPELSRLAEELVALEHALVVSPSSRGSGGATSSADERRIGYLVN